LSEMFGIRNNVTWGAAGSPASPVPTYIQSWWTQNSCQTSTLFLNDTCQQTANVFSECSTGNTELPGFIQQFCNLSPCNHVSAAFPQMAGASNFWHFMPFFFGAAPMMPTALTITGKNSSAVSFSFTQNDPGLIDFQIDTSTAQDGSRFGTIFSVSHGTFNGSWGIGNFPNQNTPCMRIRASKHAETPTYTMWTNTVCFSAPPPTMVNLGLGNGALFCTPDLSLCNIEPTLNSPFKVFWSVCNSGSSAAGATTTKVIQTDPFGAQTVTSFPVSSVPSGQCVNQSTASLTVNTGGHWNWDVFVDSANQVTEVFEMDNFGGTGSNF
jgi:hypothetical protein